ALWTASLREIIKNKPQVELDVLVQSQWADLLTGVPGLKKIWQFNRPDQFIERGISIIRLAHSLRKENYDSVYVFHASPSSAALAILSGARKRIIHFHGKSRLESFSSLPIPHQGTIQPAIDRDFNVLRAAGIEPQSRLTELPVRTSTQKDLL